MPSLRVRLQEEDRAFRHLVAEAWGLNPPLTALEPLLQALLDPERIAAMWQALPPVALNALHELAQHGGRMPWSRFALRYGEVRDLPPSQWAQAKPHLRPASIAEALWYRALIGRAFFPTEHGLQEFAYIPDEFLALLPPPPQSAEAPRAWGREAEPDAYQHPRPSIGPGGLHVLARVLGRVRAGFPLRGEHWRPWPFTDAWWFAYLEAGGLWHARGGVQAETARAWLTQPWAQAWLRAWRTWRDTPLVNDLLLLPHLQPEGQWQNDPLRPRHRALTWLAALPPNTWWDVEAWLADIREHEPDFQRSLDAFDTWYLRDRRDGRFLRGLEAWDQVEGALLRFYLAGPWHLFGLVDVAQREPNGPITAFRVTEAGAALLADRAPDMADPEPTPMNWHAPGYVQVPWRASRALHYQLARWMAPDPPTPAGLPYRWDGQALRAARGQGLRLEHIRRVLTDPAVAAPEPVLQAVTQAWHGRPGRIERVCLLRLPDARALAALRRSPLRRAIREHLTATTVILDAALYKDVLRYLWEQGFFIEDRCSPTESPHEPGDEA
ncbi:MAG: hypothetical protein GXO36_06675 [Chloroflexi bacterium]|nr:hypothetical protein [Chloroflexota bacterium]